PACSCRTPQRRDARTTACQARRAPPPISPSSIISFSRSSSSTTSTLRVCLIGIAAGRIAHLFQIQLHLRRDAGEVIDLLVWNPSEIHLAEKERLGVQLRVGHRDVQRKVVFAAPMEALYDVRIDAMGIAALGGPGLRRQPCGVHNERVVVFPTTDR